MQERRSYSHRTVFAWLFASLVVAMAAAFYIYVRYVRFDSVALDHLPQEPARIVRLNVEQAVVYEPFRRHLLPLLEKNSEDRLERLKAETTVEFGVDVRELVWAETADDEWVLVLGGLFRREGVLEGLQRVFEMEGIELEERTGAAGQPQLVHESGPAFGIAQDGAWIVASSPALLQEARSAATAPDEARGEDALRVLLRAPPPGHDGPAFSWASASVLPNRDFPTRVQLALERAPQAPPAVETVLRGPLGRALLLGDARQLSMQSEVNEARWVAMGALTREQFEGAVEVLAQDIEQALPSTPLLPRR